MSEESAKINRDISPVLVQEESTGRLYTNGDEKADLVTMPLDNNSLQSSNVSARGVKKSSLKKRRGSKKSITKSVVPKKEEVSRSLGEKVAQSIEHQKQGQDSLELKEITL